jgi:hypothetical protein
MTDDSDLPIARKTEDFLLSWFVAIDEMCKQYLLEREGLIDGCHVGRGAPASPSAKDDLVGQEQALQKHMGRGVP